MKRLIFLPCLLLAMDAAARCPEAPSSEMPAVPDGSVATEAAMLVAQAEFRAYVSSVEGYLECMSPLLVDHYHDALVEQAREAARAYNDQLQRYRLREPQVASN